MWAHAGEYKRAEGLARGYSTQKKGEGAFPSREGAEETLGMHVIKRMLVINENRRQQRGRGHFTYTALRWGNAGAAPCHAAGSSGDRLSYRGGRRGHTMRAARAQPAAGRLRQRRASAGLAAPVEAEEAKEVEVAAGVEVGAGQGRVSGKQLNGQRRSGTPRLPPCPLRLSPSTCLSSHACSAPAHHTQEERAGHSVQPHQPQKEATSGLVLPFLVG